MELHIANSLEDIGEKFMYAWRTIEPFDLKQEYDYFFVALGQNNYAKFEDFYSIAAYVVLITLVHLACRFLIFKPIGRALLPKPKGKSEPSIPKVNKFITAAWKGSSYASLVCFGIFCMWGEDWATDTAKFWRGWPMPITFWVQQLYFVECAYYIHATIVIFWEPKMKDRNELLLHHFATVSLMGLSYCWGYYRIGAVIMVLHDFSDPFMEMAKVFLYIGHQSKGDISFALFTLAFLGTRCVIYPVYILSSVWSEARIECPYCCGWWTFNILLFTLQFLHIFWAILILKILYTALTAKKVQGDIREEDDDD